MPAYKIHQINPRFGAEEIAGVVACLESGWITEGRFSEEFVQEFRALTGVEYAVLAPNGTLALYLGLSALGIGPGDEVIVPSFTFYASATAVIMTGARPVFCDVEQSTYQMDVADAIGRITPRTKAVMPVHMYGAAMCPKEIAVFRDQYGLRIIGDAAQAVGVRDCQGHAGTSGDVGCFSFFADKTITSGEGGMVVTNDEEIFTRLLYLRNQGRVDRGSFIHPELGYNFRMTDLQAAVGLAQLRKLDTIVREKLRVLKHYEEELADRGDVDLFHPSQCSTFVPFRAACLVPDKAAVMAALEESGVQTRGFFYPMHLQPKLRAYADRSLPVAEHLYEHGVCLPCYPDLSQADVQYICHAMSR